MRVRFQILLLCAMCFVLSACDFGEVDQGRCVAYNPDNKTFTMVLDVNHDAQNPSYTGGVMNFQMPSDPKEIGPEPVAGGRVLFDIEKKIVKIFVDGQVKDVNVEFTDIQKDIFPNNPKVAGKKFPVIDKDKAQITEYSRRLHSLVTFTVPADMLSLPDSTWEAGDECRVYYKPNAKHMVLRFMNVTRTNIFKK